MERALRAPRMLAGVALAASLLTGTHVVAMPLPRPGVELGAMGCRPFDAESFGDAEPTNAFGYAIAGTLKWGLPGRLSLRSGVRLSQDVMARELGLELSSGGVPLAGISGTSRTRFLRLGVPVRVGVPLPMGHGWSVEAGAEPQYLLRATLDDDITFAAGTLAPMPVAGRRPAEPAATIFENVGPHDDVTAFQPRWNLLLSAGLGFEFPLRAATGTLRLRYHHGVSDQGKGPETRYYPRLLELGLGLSW